MEEIKKGKPVDKQKMREYLSMKWETRNGTPIKIVEYNSYNDITIEFQDRHKYRTKTNISNLLKKNIKNPYFPIVAGKGYMGEIKREEYALKERIAWNSMLVRCYNKKTKEKNITYEKCEVCDEWLNFANFHKWLIKQENYDKWLNNRNFAIDKDIINKNNKIYSPDNCVIVSSYVNSLFTNHKNHRGKCLIGVKEQHNCSRYEIGVNIKKRRVSMMGFENQEKAFEKYKELKEKEIKRVAQEEYKKGNINKKCYEAMLNYKVEIND